ncbi:hypothetical protein EJ05DRAFT_541103 [Pseudovirgaria hyperparasitica]|uniref:Kinetochore protein SPC25 n=1 Tax=Pseudovirgaria hyperparasitica TaxID=470096 RepID=A0A6A6W0B6_9PEZI|nr:uncharacterized protein EJ05DRAFT_541103 [Pseudovirgaria hyperparasitica]KAF2754511.1 hypothetical protein EJ05DRAFT_541103 [Pseudovirgaria hyperparasitica]
MAAVAFDSSMGANTLRPPFDRADAISTADSLPSVQFGFEDLRDRMQRFTQRFDAFIELGRKRVLEERNKFRMNVSELQEDQRMKKRDIEILTLKQTTHAQTLAKESQETDEMNHAIAALTAQRDERLAARDALKSQIVEIQTQISSRREAQAAHKKHLERESRYNEPELDFWETHLGLRIEGAGYSDHLKFTYTCVNEKDPSIEAWFELDTGSREYRIIQHRPKLEQEAVEGALDRLSSGRMLAPFLREMRQLFIDALK